MNGIILDVAILAVLLLFTLLGAKKGFVLTLCSLVAVIVALAVAGWVSNAAAPMVGEAIRPTVERTVSDFLSQQLEGVDSQISVGLVADQALDALRDKGGLYAMAADALEEALPETLDLDAIPAASQLIGQAATQVATAVAQQLARGILFLITFLLALLLWNILAHALDLVAKLPVLHQLNALLGAAIGFVKGAVIAAVVVWALCRFTTALPPQAVADSYLLSLLAPLGLFQG